MPYIYIFFLSERIFHNLGLLFIISPPAFGLPHNFGLLLIPSMRKFFFSFLQAYVMVRTGIYISSSLWFLQGLPLLTSLYTIPLFQSICTCMKPPPLPLHGGSPSVLVTCLYLPILPFNLYMPPQRVGEHDRAGIFHSPMQQACCNCYTVSAMMFWVY